MLALENYKVLDLSVTTPFLTMILGDLGAEVLRIEPPVDTNDPAARYGLSPTGENAHKEAGCFARNRNKKSLVLNLKDETGKQIFFKLVQKADVIVEAYRPGVTKRLGIDYESAKKFNPRIIYCSVSGYGQTGPYASSPGHDINYLAVAGVLGLIGNRNGYPVKPLNLLGDMVGGGYIAVVGILSALLARETTGKGQYVDVSMTDGVFSLLTQVVELYISSGIMPKIGEAMLSNVPYDRVYKAKDGKFIAIACMGKVFWDNLCHEIGRDDFCEWGFNPSHLKQSPSGGKWEEITSYLEQTFLSKTRDEWFELLSKKNIPVSKVNNLDEAFEDPQIKHRQMIVELENAAGKVKQVGIGLKLSDTPGQIRSLSPLYGEHTDEVLRSLGYSSEEIQNFHKREIVK